MVERGTGLQVKGCRGGCCRRCPLLQGGRVRDLFRVDHCDVGGDLPGHLRIPAMPELFHRFAHRRIRERGHMMPGQRAYLVIRPGWPACHGTPGW